MKKIRIAGPPGTGKTRRLVKAYYYDIPQYSATEIIAISHTNTAANEIRKRVLDKKSIQEYLDSENIQGEKGKELFKLVRESKNTVKETITTMHKCFMSRIGDEKEGKPVIFTISPHVDDYENLKDQFPLFNKYTGSRKFYSLEMLIAGHPFFRFHSAARDNGLDTVKYYLTLDFPEKESYEYLVEELQELEKNYKDFKTTKKMNDRAERLLDFQDMIEHFTNSEKIKSEDLGIKILIVDEAQDSSVIQEAAEEKMAAAVDIFYKAGDPDQSLFGFAGANPDAFHKEFAHPEEELKEGFRCPRVINEYCKDIIRPLWIHYEYAGGGRVWTPRRELDKEGKPTGPIVEGEKFELMNLEQDPNLAELTKRITQTSETFAFTYRGNEPKEIIKYLIKTGVPFRITDKHHKFKFQYPTVGIKNQRNFFKLINKNEKVSAAGVKSILKNILFEYAGKNYSKETVDELGTGSVKYDIEWLIKHQFLSPSVRETDDFQNISKTIKVSYLETIEIKNFIRNVTRYDPLDSLKKNPRIFLENIHTIKGKEFDNSIVDLTILREEEDFTKRRIKYVACSRAKKTLWIIKSRNGMTL